VRSFGRSRRRESLHENCLPKHSGEARDRWSAKFTIASWNCARAPRRFLDRLVPETPRYLTSGTADSLHQGRAGRSRPAKVERSGLQGFFEFHRNRLREKITKPTAPWCNKHKNREDSDARMIGNSPRSDIQSAMKIGAQTPCQFRTSNTWQL
jgi:hypothetical protein